MLKPRSPLIAHESQVNIAAAFFRSCGCTMLSKRIGNFAGSNRMLFLILFDARWATTKLSLTLMARVIKPKFLVR